MRFLVSDPPWHTSSPLWRRSSLEKIGGFNERIIYGDDADLHLRALFNGMTFVQQAALLPDTFIRRANHDRITNSLSQSLLLSRLNRLTEGTAIVKQFGTALQQLAWQGQFFIECEFLIFKVKNNTSAICRVMSAWYHNWKPAWHHWWPAVVYLFFARLLIRNCYFLLRLARRVAMCILPTVFFPQTGRFESEVLPPERLKELRQLLGYPND